MELVRAGSGGPRAQGDGDGAANGELEWRTAILLDDAIWGEIAAATEGIWPIQLVIRLRDKDKAPFDLDSDGEEIGRWRSAQEIGVFVSRTLAAEGRRAPPPLGLA